MDFYQEIRSSVLEIIGSVSQRDNDSVGLESDDALLSDKPFFLSSIELVYLFFELEKHFCIRFAPKDVQAKQFATVHGITTLILSMKYASTVA